MFKKVPVEVPEGHRYCFTCKTTLPLAQFYRERRRADGHMTVCKACLRQKVEDRKAIQQMMEEMMAEQLASEAVRQAEINASYVPPTAQPREPQYRGFTRNPYRHTGH